MLCVRNFRAKLVQATMKEANEVAPELTASSVSSALALAEARDDKRSILAKANVRTP